MSQPKILKEVKEFVARYLPSVEHLEVFVLLQQNPARSWSPADVAAEFAIPDHAAADVLERLASDNFLDIRILNDVVYRFNPVSPAQAEVAAHCADTYRRKRILLIKLATAVATWGHARFRRLIQAQEGQGRWLKRSFCCVRRPA